MVQDIDIQQPTRLDDRPRDGYIVIIYMENPIDFALHAE